MRALLLSLAATLALLCAVSRGSAQVYTCSNSLYSLGALSMCGNFAYHPAEHVCCGGVLNQRTGGDNVCCDTEWVHVENCCRGMPVDPGNGTACCEGNVYNPNDEACCADGGTVVQTTATTACCHNPESNTNTAYDASASSCCGGVIRSRPSFPEREVCCDDGTYTTYDSTATTLACCETGKESTVYDQTNQLCCEDGPIDIPDTINSYDCCGAEIYNTDDFDCCDGNLVTKMDDHICCGSQYYDVSNLDNPACCGTTIFDLSAADLTCCAETVYNNDDQACVQESCRRCGDNEDCVAATSAASAPAALVGALALALAAFAL